MTIAILYFAAYFESFSTVGPGPVSAVSAHFERSFDGQKYGPLKISWRQRIWTPCLPASSIIGMCFSSMALRIVSTDAFGSLIGFDIWIRPPMTSRAMCVLVRKREVR